MSIPGPGPYKITDYTGKKRIGRGLHENDDQSPKPIFAGTDDPHPIWEVERLATYLHVLRIKMAPTTDDGGKLVALVTDQEKRTEWRLATQGGHLAIIEDYPSGKVWTIPESNEEKVQIVLEPLQPGNKNQLFKFTWQWL